MHSHNPVTTFSDFGSIVSAIEGRGYLFVCFDFGGTLFDFTLLHIRGFLDALDIYEDSDSKPIVERTVREALDQGLDSFEMVRLIANAINREQDLNLEAVVAKKRSLVEEYLRKAKLDECVCRSLAHLLSFTSVAVISLGHVDSMKKVLKRSLGDLAGRIAVYGRLSITERVDKRQLLRRALDEASTSRHLMVYVGDADLDEFIALELGIDSIRVQHLYC